MSKVLMFARIGENTCRGCQRCQLRKHWKVDNVEDVQGIVVGKYQWCSHTQKMYVHGWLGKKFVMKFSFFASYKAAMALSSSFCSTWSFCWLRFKAPWFFWLYLKSLCICLLRSKAPCSSGSWIEALIVFWDFTENAFDLLVSSQILLTRFSLFLCHLPNTWRAIVYPKLCYFCWMKDAVWGHTAGPTSMGLMLFLLDFSDKIYKFILDTISFLSVCHEAHS